jgi:hypothetical protein
MAAFDGDCPFCHLSFMSRADFLDHVTTRCPIGHPGASTIAQQPQVHPNDPFPQPQGPQHNAFHHSLQVHHNAAFQHPPAQPHNTFQQPLVQNSLVQQPQLSPPLLQSQAPFNPRLQQRPPPPLQVVVGNPLAHADFELSANREYGVVHAREFGFTELTTQQLLATTNNELLLKHKCYIPRDYFPTDPRTQKIWQGSRLNTEEKRAFILLHAKSMLKFSRYQDVADEALANKLADTWDDKKGVLSKIKHFMKEKIREKFVLQFQAWSRSVNIRFDTNVSSVNDILQEFKREEVGSNATFIEAMMKELIWKQVYESTASKQELALRAMDEFGFKYRNSSSTNIGCFERVIGKARSESKAPFQSEKNRREIKLVSSA